VRVSDGASKIVLKAGEEVRQVFKVPVSTLSGIVFYSDPDFVRQDIGVKIVNKDGREISSDKKIVRRYSDAKTTINVFLESRRYKSNEQVSLIIKNLGGQDLSIWRTEKGGEEAVAFSIIEPRRISERERYGAYSAAIFALGLGLIQFIKSNKKKFISLLFLLALVTPVALAGFWQSDKWGVSDWDYYFSVHDAYRQSIVNYHTFPLWTPYTAGGTAGLGDPEFPVFTITFLSELIFGVPTGLRIAIILSILIGGVGMMRLSRSLGLSAEGSATAAIVYMFGGVNLLEIVEGHVNVFAAMWIPWIMWSWLQMAKRKRGPLLCGVFLALTFYAGGIYLLMYTTVAFLFLPLFTTNKFKNYLLTLKAGLIALGLSAFKLVPVFLWLRSYSDTAYASSTNILPWLNEIFLERILHGTDVIFGQGSGWHEYGAYVGLLTVILALIGLLYMGSKKVVWVLGLAVLAAVIVSASGPFLKPLFDVFPYIPRSNISRFVLFAVIPLALLSAYGTSLVEEKVRFGGRIFVFGALILLALDLMTYSNALSRQAFVVEPIRLQEKAEYPIEYSGDSHGIELNGQRYSRSYSSLLSGYGSTTFPSVLGPESKVNIIESEDKHSFAEVGGTESAEVTSWTPNRVTIEVAGQREGSQLVINGNYANGWFANDRKAENVDGRIGTTIKEGEKTIVFRYKTPGFVSGAIITSVTILVLVASTSKKALPKLRAA